MGSCQQKPIGVRPKPIGEINNNIVKETSVLVNNHDNPKIKLRGSPVTQPISNEEQASSLAYTSKAEKVLPRRASAANLPLATPEGSSGNHLANQTTNNPSSARQGWRIMHQLHPQTVSGRKSEKDLDNNKNQAGSSIVHRDSHIFQIIPITVTRKSNSLLKSPQPDSQVCEPSESGRVKSPNPNTLKVLRRDNTLQVYSRERLDKVPVVKHLPNMSGFLTLRPNSARRSVAVTSVAQNHHKNLLELVEHGKVTAPAIKQLVSSSKMVDIKLQAGDKVSNERVSDNHKAVLSNKRVKLLHLEDSEAQKSVCSSQQSPPSRFVQKAPMSSRMECSIMDADAESIGRKDSIQSDESNEQAKAQHRHKAAERKFRLASAQPSRRILTLHHDEDKSSRDNVRRPLLVLSDAAPHEHVRNSEVDPMVLPHLKNTKEAKRKRHRKIDSTVKLDHRSSPLKEFPLVSNRSSFGPGAKSSMIPLTELKKWGSMMMPSDMVKHKSSLNLLNRLTQVEPVGVDIVAKVTSSEEFKSGKVPKHNRSHHEPKSPSDGGSSSESPPKMDRSLSNSLFIKKQKGQGKRVKNVGTTGGKHKRLSSDEVRPAVKFTLNLEVSDSDQGNSVCRSSDDAQPKVGGQAPAVKKKVLEHKHSLQIASRFAREQSSALCKPELPVLNEGNSEPCSPTTRQASMH